MIRTAMAVLFAAFSAGAAAQGLPGCGCDDVREMHDRWCSARAARSEYERIKSAFETAQSAAGERRMLSPADKDMINQVCVQEVIRTTSDRGVVKATGKTYENLKPWVEDCSIEVAGSELNACQIQIVAEHETNHSKACLARRARFKDMNINVRTKLETVLYGASSMAKRNATNDTKFLMTSAEFASEEAASYAIEAQLISAKWKELQQNCIAQAFEIELEDASKASQSLWDSITPDANGKRIHKMYDLSQSRCPNHPRPSPSQCTIK